VPAFSLTREFHCGVIDVRYHYSAGQFPDPSTKAKSSGDHIALAALHSPKRNFASDQSLSSGREERGAK
jgi:hypothetical protein